MSEQGAVGPLRTLGGMQVLRRLDQARVNAAPAQARVFNSADITVANNTIQALTFNSERYDTGDFHSTSANTSRLTAPTAGLYSIGGNVRFAANATGRRLLAIRLNGTTVIGQNEPSSAVSATVQCVLPVSTEYQLDPSNNDYVELIVFQTSGGALNVLATGDFSPEFWIHRVGSQA